MIGILVALKTFLEIDAVAGTIGVIDAGLNVASLFDIVKKKFKKDSIEYQTACALDEALKESCRVLGWEYDALAVSQELDVETLLISTVMTKEGLGDLFKKLVGVELDSRALDTIIDCFDKSVAEKDKLHRYLDQKWKRDSGKHSPLAVSIPITTIPFPISLIGREDDITAIRSLIAQENIVSVRADGGVGKTVTAARIVNDVKGEIERGESTFKHAAWIKSTGKLKEDLVGLEVPTVESSESIDEKFRAACRFLKQNPTFLVIDNMDIPPSDWEVDTLNTISGSTKVLITTRSSIPEFKTYILKTLDRESAICLFYKHYPVDPETEYDSKVTVGKIADAASCNALLVELIAKMAYWEYIDRLEELWITLEKDVFGTDSEIEIENVHAYSHLSKDDLKLLGQVRNLYHMSELTEAQQELMRLFAVFPPEATIFASVFKWAGFAVQDLKYLTERGWIEKVGDGFLIHTMVKGSVSLQDRAFDVVKYNNLIERLCDTELYMPKNMVHTKVRERIIVPETIFSLLLYENIKKANIATLCVLSLSLANEYSNMGDYRKALEFYQKNITISKMLLGAEHPSTALSYHNFAIMCLDLGAHEKALEYFEKALTVRKKVLGIEHPDTADTYGAIGNVYKEQGNYRKALAFNEKALAIKEKVLGAEHLETANTYINLALVYRALGDYKKALEYLWKALIVQEKVLGDKHLKTAETYNNLANVYSAQGDFEKALEYYGKALAIKEKVLGAEHPSTARTYGNLSGVYLAQLDLEKALEYSLKALTVSEKMLGLKHPYTAKAYGNVSGVYLAQGDFEKALEYSLKALAVTEKMLGAEHPDTAKMYGTLATVYAAQDNYGKALEYFGKGLSIMEKVLGAEHPETASMYNALALVYMSQGDYGTAQEYLDKGLKTIKERFGKDHLFTKGIETAIDLFTETNTDKH